MPKKGYTQTEEHSQKIKKVRGGWKKKNPKGWLHGGRRVIMHNGKEVFEHRVIMERHIGRELTENEVVHHINGDITDNRIENLQLMTKGQHVTLHNTGKNRKDQAKGWKWTPEQREKYLVALRKRPPLSPEARQKISETMKRVRKEKYWSSRKITEQSPNLGSHYP